MLRELTANAIWIALPVLSIASLPAERAFALVEHNVPKAIEFATDLGRVEPSREQNLTLVLKTHGTADLDKTIEALYDPESPTYHQWLSDADLDKYAPTEAEYAQVRNALTAQGLHIISTDPRRFSIRVHGTVESIETAFQTQLHNFSYRGKTFQAHIADAHLTGAAAALVDSVSGLDRRQVRPQALVATNPVTGKPISARKKITDGLGSTLAGEITDVALSSAEEFNFTTPGASLPESNFWGTVYNLNPKLTVSFTPKQLQSHYGLTTLLKEGYDGRGQTIVLVEGYGNVNAEKDANVAAKAFGLPPLDSSNYAVVYPEGPPLDPNAADLTGWTIEIALDIQSSHAIAPGAKIVVVATSGQDNEDFIHSLQYIVTKRLGSAVSNSWEEDTDLFSGPDENNAFNAVLKLGAAAGISIQFSSGDGGDGGLGTPLGAPGVPSNSPYAVAVGGTSILNDPYGSSAVVTGWGNNGILLNDDGAVDPPLQEGFFGGSGGGESVFFAKPSWQKSLPGHGRQVPDVSALADPYTGFPLIFTEGGQPYAEAGWGGTSLASPIFTAIWAIADQYNGKPLGQAAPLIAKLKSGEIHDVVPPPTSVTLYNPSGTVHDDAGTTFYSAADLYSGLLYTTTDFVSTIWNIDSALSLSLSFGTDTSLKVTPGWDNVTGFGEPNGLPFIQGVTGKTKGSPVKP
jgi:subtilase family serine protease